MNTKSLLSIAAGKILLSSSLAYATETVSFPISVTESGSTANNNSSSASISADGRFTAFDSYASDLVSNDNNNTSDIFVYDQLTNTTQRISVNSAGEQANDNSHSPSISADGRYITFVSDASNLDADDLAYSNDIFVHDRVTGNTTRVSSESLAPMGKFESGSTNPAISADGNYITYQSTFSNLVYNDTNRVTDIFVYDQLNQTTRRISVDSNENQATNHSYTPSISADGRYISFSSAASNLIYNDSNGETKDIFVYDQELGIQTLININNSGIQANADSITPIISEDGRYITFGSAASNLVTNDNENTDDIFVYDRYTRTQKLISVTHSAEPTSADDFSFSPSISEHGRYISFSSNSNKLVENDDNQAIDVFIYDQELDSLSLVSINALNEQGNAASLYPAISADGQSIAYNSNASNFTLDDNNASSDIFLKSQLDGSPEAVLEPLEITEYYAESFETITWQKAWNSDGWSIDNRYSTAGTHSLRSNPITNNQTAVTEWHINTENAGEFSFKLKVDSELNYDFFEFYIDGVLQNRFSGSIDWTQHSYNLSAGEHILKFTYQKDNRYDSGADSVWIDELSFNSDDYFANQLIENFYINILDRSPSTASIDYWSGVMQKSSATKIALYLFNTDRFQSFDLNNRDFIEVAYAAILNKEANTAELDYWQSRLDNGLLRSFLLYYFCQSPTFHDLAEQAKVTAYSESDHKQFQAKAFTKRLYVYILSREPDQGGLNYWSTGLLNGQFSAADVATQLLFSKGFTQQNYDNRKFIQVAYLSLLGRTADEKATTYWVGELESWKTRQQVVEILLATSSFEQLALSYQLTAH